MIKRKTIALLGCTGSIGRQTLSVIRKHLDCFELVLVANNCDIDGIIAITKEFNPKTAISGRAIIKKIGSTNFYSDLSMLNRPETYYDIDIVINGIVGISGLLPTLAIIESGSTLATANKESLVCAGSIINKFAKSKNSIIRPIDSEHSTIWQCLEKITNIKSLILTASGGAFRDYSIDQLANAKAVDALKHPTWVMGQKVTIDSATLVNKGMEIIEAKHFFDVKDIEVVLHRESIVHSLVQMVDNTLIAGLSKPNMIIPIQYALTYPDRLECDSEILDLAKIATLNFSAVDEDKYPIIKIAHDVAQKGDFEGTIFCACNDILVKSYLEDKIKYFDIPKIVFNALSHYKSDIISDIGDVLKLIGDVQSYTKSVVFGGK